MSKAATNFPLLEEILAIKDLPLQAFYTIRNVATIFGISTRAIQAWVAGGHLPARDVPGRARFLNEDLEAFLISSRKRGS